MTLWQSIILGIVEGITEFLPISSTGHLILAGEILRIPESAFTTSFDIIIQLGAILAVVVLFWKKLLQLEVWKKIFVAFLPAMVIGLALYNIVKTYFLASTTLVLWSLFIGGTVLILFEIWYSKKDRVESPQADLSYRQAFIIGLFQCLALIPGVSRSGASIVGGLSLGLSRLQIAEFSFLLAIPTMLAASGLDLVQNYSLFTTQDLGALSVGFITSFIVALLAIQFLLKYIQRHNFIAFGVYRMLVAVAFWVLFV